MANQNSRYLLTKKGEDKFVVFASDIAVSRKLYIGADVEYIKTEKAIEILREKGAIKNIRLLLDVGANLGHILIPILNRNPAARAIGFEPDPNNFRLLSANVLINNLSGRVELHNMALGARIDERLTFELSPDNAGDHRVRVSNSDGVYGEVSRETISVPSTTLDSFFPSGVQSDSTLLWMDVQGYEGFVLEGAKRLIGQRMPIGLEFWPYGMARTGSFPRLLAALESYGSYYDLNSEIPEAHPIAKLKELYEEKKGTQYWTDILMF